MVNLRLTVDIEYDEEDGLYYVDCKDLQGCHSFGETEEEALENATNVIMDHVDVRLRNSLKAQLEAAHREKQATTPTGHRHTLDLVA